MRAGRLRPALAAVLFVVGCGGGGSYATGGDASAVVETTALSTARALAVPDRAVAEVLRGRLPIAAEGSGFAVAAKNAGDLALHVAPRASDPTRIGTDDDHALSLALVGAAGHDAETDDGAILHRDVFPSTDAVWATTESRAELLFLLRDASAPTRFELRLQEGADLKRPELGEAGLSFRDGRGNVRLTIPAPVALDARGEKRVAKMTLSGDTLTLELDASGLSYPVLLDPAVLQARWVSQGNKLSRTCGSLLWDPTRSKLLAYGGYVAGSGPNEPGNAATTIHGYTFPGRTFDPIDSSGPGGFTTAMLGPLSGSAAQNYGYFAAFDTTRNKLVAIGGSQYDCSSSCTTNYRVTVFEWDSATNAWTERCTDSACAASAPGASQKGIEVVYDQSRKYTLACKRSGSCARWDGTAGTWTAMPSLPTTLTRGFYDTKYGAATFLGGDGTYSWNGSAWVKRTTSSFFALGATYDTIRKKAVAITGSTSGLEYVDTYEWDGTSGAWTLVAPKSSAAPLGAYDTALGFDPVNGRVVAWGGGNGQTSYYAFDFLQGVWEYQAFGNACAGDVDCLGGSCRDGFCCDARCGACQRCDGPGNGGVCATFAGAASTGTEHDTCTGNNACDPSGACKLKNGQACTSGLQCVSGACVDGFCCSTACNQACEVCNVTPGTCTPAPKGSSGRTSCAPGSCNGTLRVCTNTCGGDSDCSATGYCSGTTCVSTLGNGAACTRDRQCTSGSCRDGFCCDKACNGACEACSVAKGASANGTCTSLPTSAKPAACGGYACSGTSGACAAGCSADSDCASGYYCDGAFCQKTRAQGEGCARTAQCAAGLSCADGVCCNSACDGACQACAAANKQSGDAAGTCGPAKAGSDPGDRCPKEDASTCGKSGVCGATGTCALYAKGTACGGGVSCDAGTAKGKTCDGLGVCLTDTAGTACAPGTCSTSAGCTFTCTTDAECDASGFCDSGTCKARSPVGRTCTANNQCSSGFCVDGVCCGSACTGVCEACNGAGTEGTCTAVAGGPRAGHGSCPGASSDDACTAAACDGSARNECKALAGPEVTCRPASCTDAVESLAVKCDGTGKCPAPSTRACAPFGCVGARCGEACSNDEECAKGSRCDGSKCVSKGTCDGQHTVVGADGSKTECSPYRCDDKGCKNACTGSEECAAPAICDGSKCVLSAAPAEDSGGCTASRRGTRSSLLILVFFAAFAARRRVARKGAL